MTTDAKIEITDASVLAKIEKGEELSPAEQEHLKSSPAAEGHPSAPEAKEEDPDDIVIKKDGSGSDTPKKSEEENPAETSADAGKEKKQTPEERQKLIEAELVKPEAEQDLSKFSDSEIGTYWDLRRERKRRQKAEEENEVLKIERIADRLKKELAPEPKKEEEADPLAFLDGKADDDILTVAEAKQLAKALKAKPAAKKEDEPAKEEPKPKMLRTVEQVQVESKEADTRLKAKGIDDFYEVTDFAADVLKDDEDARDILRETAKAGGNTAEKTYWIIRGSKAWPQIKKAIETQREKVKKPEKKEVPSDNERRAKRLEENDGKIKTTGAGTGAAGEVGEYSNEEIAAMSIDDIKKLPKETRKLILKKFGSEPNLRG